MCVCVEAVCCHDALRLQRWELIHREPKGGWFIFFHNEAVSGAGIETLPRATRLMGLHHHTDQLMAINLTIHFSVHVSREFGLIQTS